MTTILASVWNSGSCVCSSVDYFTVSSKQSLTRSLRTEHQSKKLGTKLGSSISPYPLPHLFLHQYSILQVFKVTWSYMERKGKKLKQGFTKILTQDTWFLDLSVGNWVNHYHLNIHSCGKWESTRWLLKANYSVTWLMTGLTKEGFLPFMYLMDSNGFWAYF